MSAIVPTDRIVQSRFPPVEIPDVTVPAYIRALARERPAAVALVDGPTGRTFTYGQLDHAVGRVAAGLADIGFRPGDVFLIFAPNSPEWAIAAFAAMSAGGVVSGANSMYSAAELSHQMRSSGARFVLTVPAFLPVVRQAIEKSACETIVLLGEAEGTVAFADLLANADPEPTPALTSAALVALPFSSGTSGLPKGVMLTHANLVSNVCQFNAVMNEDANGVTLAFLPMFHIFGFTVVMLCGLAKGMKVVTIPRFEPETFLKTIASYRVTSLFVVPPILQFLAGHPLVDSFDTSSIRVILSGAAPLGPGLVERVSTRLGCAICQGFGMTESSGVVACCPPSLTRQGSSGRLMPGTSARLVDPDTGLDVDPGKSGELWFSGPQAFSGYLDNPEATHSTIRSDGWIRTGDIAHFDDDGYLYVTDRLKELIKVNGYQVAPAELEALLIGHPQVADAAVIGRADDRAGERAVAYVVFRDGLDAEGLMAWVAERVVEYKHLGDVVACDEIPKTASGKILRRVLRERDRARP